MHICVASVEKTTGRGNYGKLSEHETGVQPRHTPLACNFSSRVKNLAQGSKEGQRDEV